MFGPHSPEIVIYLVWWYSGYQLILTYSQGWEQLSCVAQQLEKTETRVSPTNQEKMGFQPLHETFRERSSCYWEIGPYGLFSANFLLNIRWSTKPFIMHRNISFQGLGIDSTILRQKGSRFFQPSVRACKKATPSTLLTNLNSGLKMESHSIILEFHIWGGDWSVSWQPHSPSD